MTDKPICLGYEVAVGDYIGVAAYFNGELACFRVTNYNVYALL